MRAYLIRLFLWIALIIPFLAVSEINAETLPTFHPGIWRKATEIVVVDTLTPSEARFRVLEIWQGTFRFAGQELSIPEADFVCPDGVSGEDYAYFALRWRDENCGDSNDCDGVDFDFSGAVDWGDFRIFCDHWLEEK